MVLSFMGWLFLVIVVIVVVVVELCIELTIEFTITDDIGEGVLVCSSQCKKLQYRPEQINANAHTNTHICALLLPLLIFAVLVSAYFQMVST